MADEFTAGTFDEEARRRQAGGALAGGIPGTATGAAVGTALGPGGTIAGAIIGGGIGALSGLQKTKRSSIDKLRDDLLEKELLDAQRGELGLSQAEKDRQIADAQEVANARIQSQQADIARSQLGSGDTFSGQFAELQRNLAGRESTAGVEASRQVEDRSRQQEQQRFAALQPQLIQKSIEDAAARASVQQRLANAATSGLSALATGIESGALQGILSGLGKGSRADMSAEELAAVEEEMKLRFGDQLGSTDLATDPSAVAGLA